MCYFAERQEPRAPRKMETPLSEDQCATLHQGPLNGGFPNGGFQHGQVSENPTNDEMGLRLFGLSTIIKMNGTLSF